MTTIEPKKITIRCVCAEGEFHDVYIEHDGVQVEHQLASNEFSFDVPVKALELKYTALGYVPDLKRMYIDMSLIVLNLYKS